MLCNVWNTIHTQRELSSSMHNPEQRQRGKPRDSDLVMDQIDLIRCSGQFLILNPRDVSEWILRGRPIQLFSLTSTHGTLRRRASERERRQTKEAGGQQEAEPRTTSTRGSTDLSVLSVDIFPRAKRKHFRGFFWRFCA